MCVGVCVCAGVRQREGEKVYLCMPSFVQQHPLHMCVLAFECEAEFRVSSQCWVTSLCPNCNVSVKRIDRC